MAVYENLKRINIGGIDYIYQISNESEDNFVDYPKVLEFVIVALKDNKIVYIHPDLEDFVFENDLINNQIIAKNNDKQVIIKIPKVESKRM